MKKYLGKFIDFLFPKTCLACGNFILSGEPSKYLCGLCYQKIKFIEPPVCEKCGVPVNSDEKYCKRCTIDKEKIYYDSIRGITYFEEPIKECIHMLKYKGKEYLRFFLSDFFINYIQKNDYLLNVDLIFSVPTHWTRKLKRGFNQSELLAELISKKFNIEYNSTNLYRKKMTKPQAKLNREERLININEAFAVRNSDSLIGKSVLIIDDVSTTGETINQCAKVLKYAGAKSIFGLTLARDI